MKHKHHIIPKHMGGTDDPSNLIELSVQEHAQAHLDLYEEHGKKEDLCAYYMLSGKNQEPEFCRLRSQIGGAAAFQRRKEIGLNGMELFYGRKVSPEEILENASKGGKIQGTANAESGHMAKIQKLADWSAAGKKGGAATIAGGKGAFADPIERLKAASNGGKKGGATNAKSGHLKKIAQDYWAKVKSGEISRNKKIWITNGIDNMLLGIDDSMPAGYRKGRITKK